MMDLAKASTWLLAALYAVTFLGIFYGVLTLAGGGIFILALIAPAWLGLVFHARRSRAVFWVAAAPILIYGLLLIASIVFQLLS